MILPTAISALLVGFAPLCAAVIYDNVESLPNLDKYDYVVVGGAFCGFLFRSRTALNYTQGELLVALLPTASPKTAMSTCCYSKLGHR